MKCADCLRNQALGEDGIVRLERLDHALMLLKAPNPLVVLGSRSLNSYDHEREEWLNNTLETLHQHCISGLFCEL